MSAQTSTLKDHSPDDRKVILDVVGSPVLASVDDVLMSDSGEKVPHDHLRLLTPGDAGYAEPQLILVVDAINSSAQDVARSEDAIAGMLKSYPGDLPLMTTVVFFAKNATAPTGKVAVAKDYTAMHTGVFVTRTPASRKAAVVLKGVNDFKSGPSVGLGAQPTDAQDDRVKESVGVLGAFTNAEIADPGPKIVLWLSPGWPFVDKAHGKSSEGVFGSILYFSAALREARILLYAMDPSGFNGQNNSAETEAYMLASRPSAIQANGHSATVPQERTETYYKQFLRGARYAGEANPNDLALQVLAEQSGGLVLYGNKDLKAQIERCMSDAKKISTLVYDPIAHPSPIPDAPLTYRPIQIKRSTNGEVLRTRAGFYGRR